MAESRPLNKTITKGCDILPDIYCDLCHDLEGQFIQAMGFCENCSDNLCQNCVSEHKRNKLTRNHQIQNQTGVPQNPSIMRKKPTTAKCHQHEGEELRSYCRSCDQLCCKICQTVDHQFCSDMQGLTKAAANIKDSQQLKDLESKLKVLKTGYNKNLSKAENQSLNIEKFNTDAINDMRKMQEKFEKLTAESGKKAKTVKTEDCKKMESISTTCNIFLKQINKISSNLGESQEMTDNETLYISMKRAESQLKSFEDRLKQMDTDNTIQQYKPEATKKLNDILDELNGEELFFSNSTKSAQMLKTPVIIKDINHQSPEIRGSILLQNQRLLLTDTLNKVKLIDTKQNTIVSELQLPDYLWDITRVKADEFAITGSAQNKIQFVSLSFDKLSIGREMSVGGQCRGIAYNGRDNTLLVTFDNPPKVETQSLTGTVIKRFEQDAKRVQLFKWPYYVALTYDKTMIYVTDSYENSVTLMTLNGDVKVVYKDESLTSPMGVCVNRFGTVYVVGWQSQTVHQIVPGSDKLELLLEQKNGLQRPCTINYCDTEDKLYVGQMGYSGFKIFKMK